MILRREVIHLFHWLQDLLAHQGYWVVFSVLFLNNLCLPVPGDSMLLGGGFLAQRGILSLWAVIAVGTGGCFLGGNGGYWIGLRFGRRFLKKATWLQVTPERIKKLERFFEKYGAKTVFFARFVALLHPVTGLLAGMGKTPFRPFLFYNLAGAFAYSTLYALVGYFFGQRWELFKSWMGPAALYTIIIAAAFFSLGLFLRKSIRTFFVGFASPKKVRPEKNRENPKPVLRRSLKPAAKPARESPKKTKSLSN
jgi:membrane protein DedA with SNARE-associated domain